MTGFPPSSAAAVTSFRWKTEAGRVHTTLIGKISIQIADGGVSLVAADPIAQFDRIAADTRYVEEASESMPWTSGGCVVAYGGPLRFTLEDAAGKPILTASCAANAPAGYSMSSNERAGLARERPTRGADGLLTIPADIDGRYFMAAPASQQGALLRGDETFRLELRGRKVEGRLPGIAITTTLKTNARTRVVALTYDMVTVNGSTRRISLIARGLVLGDAAIVSHAIGPIDQLTTKDRGDAHAKSSKPAGGEDTNELSTADLLKMRERAPTPFATEDTIADGEVPAARPSQVAVPATPFDPGFTPAQVVPAGGIVETLTPYEGLDSQLLMARVELRRQARGQSAVPAAAPAEAPAPAPAPAPEREEAAKEGARVAPPKPGAMAKPRVRRR